MSVEYHFQRSGIDPKTKKPYDSKTLLLSENDASEILQEWEVKEESGSSKKRAHESTESDSAGKKAKVEAITTYGPAFKRAVNELFVRCHGEEPEGEYSEGYFECLPEDSVKVWDEAILPLVEGIQEEDRQYAAGYAIRATCDLYAAYTLSSLDEDHMDEAADYYQQKEDILSELCEVGQVREGDVHDEEAMYVDTRDGPVWDIDLWKWRLYAVEGTIRRPNEEDRKKWAKDEQAGKDAEGEGADSDDEEEEGDEEEEEE